MMKQSSFSSRTSHHSTSGNSSNNLFSGMLMRRSEGIFFSSRKRFWCVLHADGILEFYQDSSEAPSEVIEVTSFADHNMNPLIKLSDVEICITYVKHKSPLEKLHGGMKCVRDAMGKRHYVPEKNKHEQHPQDDERDGVTHTFARTSSSVKDAMGVSHALPDHPLQRSASSSFAKRAVIRDALGRKHELPAHPIRKKNLQHAKESVVVDAMGNKHRVGGAPKEDVLVLQAESAAIKETWLEALEQAMDSE
uniref:PH domain-containing protein n=1 Tax=Hanusia phi TaxID=3032 RepID=A0A7S0DZS1_9CRYP